MYQIEWFYGRYAPGRSLALLVSGYKGTAGAGDSRLRSDCISDDCEVSAVARLRFLVIELAATEQAANHFKRIPSVTQEAPLTCPLFGIFRHTP